MLFLYVVWAFASLDVVCDDLMILPGILVCRQLSDKCVYVYCVESFAHIECHSDCSRRGSHFLVETFATVLFTVCSIVPVLHVYVFCYVRKKTLLQFLCNY